MENEEGNKDKPLRGIDELEEDDYYFNEEGLMVFTRKYLLKRGYCCKNKCKNCPYQSWPKDQS